MVSIKKNFIYLENGNVDLESWLNKIHGQYHLVDISLIKQAAQLAQSTSEGLTTFYGQPCVEQGLEMAEILLDMKLDQDTIAAAILSSAMQQTSLSTETIKESFNEHIAKLVDGVLQMNVLNTLQTNKYRDQTQIDRLRKIFLAMVSDIRVVLIKLAERTCMMRGIKHINLIERKRIAQETIDIYAPLANRLGIGQLKWELEDIAFHYTQPEIYKKIAEFLAERRADREKRIHETIERLKEHLALANIKSSISGRAKHIYSIYLKSKRKLLDYKDIYDYSAVRILVPTVRDCYAALSIVHDLWEHIPEEFDDYISNPKSNGYRSIHTAVIGPANKNLEIQIRTTDMHDEAEHGIAAHWIYKEDKATPSGYEEKIAYLRQLLAWHKDVAEQKTSIDKTFHQMLDDRVYVYTPAGEIVDLPIDATPLDFAYHIHSQLGHRCRGAKIHGHIVPLTYKLRTGDQVEIITTPNGTPSRDWLNKGFGYLHTARARSKVAHWFKQQDITSYIETGKQNLERELTRAGIQQPNFEKIASRLNLKNDEALFAAIGHGSIRIAQVLNTLQASPAQDMTPKSSISATIKTAPSDTGLQIAGINDLLTRIARCCKPIPGDDIIGFITQGRGVSIHRHDCNNIAYYRSVHDHRLIQVNWDNPHLSNYYVDLHVHGLGQEVLLKEVTALLINSKIDLVALNSTINKKNNIIQITVTVQIRDKEQLKQLMAQISHLPHVMSVKRVS